MIQRGSLTVCATAAQGRHSEIWCALRGGSHDPNWTQHINGPAAVCSACVIQAYSDRQCFDAGQSHSSVYAHVVHCIVLVSNKFCQRPQDSEALHPSSGTTSHAPCTIQSSTCSSQNYSGAVTVTPFCVCQFWAHAWCCI